LAAQSSFTQNTKRRNHVTYQLCHLTGHFRALLVQHENLFIQPTNQPTIPSHTKKYLR